MAFTAEELEQFCDNYLQGLLEFWVDTRAIDWLTEGTSSNTDSSEFLAGIVQVRIDGEWLDVDPGTLVVGATGSATREIGFRSQGFWVSAPIRNVKATKSR